MGGQELRESCLHTFWSCPISEGYKPCNPVSTSRAFDKFSFCFSQAELCLLFVTTIPSLVRLPPEILHVYPNCKYDHNKPKPECLGCLSIAYGESSCSLLWQRSLTMPGCGYDLLLRARLFLRPSPSYLNLPDKHLKFLNLGQKSPPL